uniref:Uncharacterized protein n=1 Tax=Triticum urartu TaxID=4572 RepID=A0A8R7VK71_TRIUA
MAESNSYEEQRRRQMEENRRKLEELRLHHLSAAVREAAARPKPNPKPRPVRQILSLLLPCLRSPISFFSPTYMTAAAEAQGPGARRDPAVRPRRRPPGAAQLPRGRRAARLPWSVRGIRCLERTDRGGESRRHRQGGGAPAPDPPHPLPRLRQAHDPQLRQQGSRDENPQALQ